jgi:hypothetical protein
MLVGFHVLERFSDLLSIGNCSLRDSAAGRMSLRSSSNVSGAAQ